MEMILEMADGQLSSGLITQAERDSESQFASRCHQPLVQPSPGAFALRRNCEMFPLETIT